MAFTVIRSTDAAAIAASATLTGLAGSLIAVLDYCLVTRLGWSKVYSGTNKAVYRAPSGNRLYYRVDDNGPGTATGQEARVRAYESMTDVDTGTNAFPTTAQMTNGGFVRKSAAATSTPRVWNFLGDSRTFYLLIQAGDTAGWNYIVHFGEFTPVAAGDNFSTAIIARATEASATSSAERIPIGNVNVTTAITGHYAPKNAAGTGASITLNKTGEAFTGLGVAGSFSGGLPTPNPGDGSVYLTPIWLHDTTTAPTGQIRGRMRGCWATGHASTAFSSDGDTITGGGDLTGRTFIAFGNVAGAAAFAFETSGHTGARLVPSYTATYKAGLNVCRISDLAPVPGSFVVCGPSSFWRGNARNNSEGNPTAPSLEMRPMGTYSFVLPVLSGSRSVSVDVKRTGDVSAYRPRLRVRANPDIGLSSDVVATATSTLTWQTLTASFTASADGGVEVVLELPYGFVDVTAYWDNIQAS